MFEVDISWRIITNACASFIYANTRKASSRQESSETLKLAEMLVLEPAAFRNQLPNAFS